MSLMGWSIGVRESELGAELDEYLLMLGKAVSLACSFEKKCLSVVRIGRAVEHVQTAQPGYLDLLDFLKGLDDSLLGRALRDLAALPGVQATTVDLLNRGRRARNTIVHELGNVTPVHCTLGTLHQLRAALDSAVDELIVGDNCISEWIYWIEEKEAPPKQIAASYRTRVRGWVFGEPESANLVP